MYNKINKLASAVYNNINSGLQGISGTDSISMELLEDAVVLERLLVLKEYSLKGILPYKDLYLSINCIPVDCKDLDRCPKCRPSQFTEPVAHCLIPLIMNDYGLQAIEYFGSTDRQLPFLIYTSPVAMKFHNYRKRGKSKPYVWIDTTPNSKGMYDCFIFNAPFLNQISISAIFKDLRLLLKYGCCSDSFDDNFSFIDNEVIKRLTEKMIRYYVIGSQPVQPNNQEYKPG